MKKTKQVELLAPAGSFEGFLGAIHAGADAVYLGGDRYGARAYANNFTTEEIIEAIRIAHLWNRKVYLTVNTLMKEKELAALQKFLLPLYEAGLDAVIIQDLGAFHLIGEYFPGLERHVSTQMAITGKYGAAYLKELGAARIVPARELCLEEIRRMKEEADIEIETFIHGAICYCYSGQCLFSSLVGGRSGNRGRCAQPCRLPYQTEEMKKPAHLLSLKDMSTVELIPELVTAGIDSFKIEGRMKSPEYAAGVTAIYRKYIDLYLAGEPFLIKEEDQRALSKMYIRSEIQDGYYHKKNGPEMITLDNPGYAGQDEGLLQEIREKYLKPSLTIPVRGTVTLSPGEKARINICYDGYEACAEGDLVMDAKKQPLTREAVEKQFRKTGGGSLVFDELTVDLQGECFLPVAALNQLRRNGLACMEKAISAGHGFLPPSPADETLPLFHEPGLNRQDRKNRYRRSSDKDGQLPELHLSLTTTEQFLAVCQREERKGKDNHSNNVRRIYLSSDCLELNRKTDPIHRQPDWEAGIRKLTEIFHKRKEETELYLALPYILRDEDNDFLEIIKQILKQTNLFQGLLVRNLETLGWIRQEGISLPAVTDAGVYVWNRETALLFGRHCSELYLPYELNGGELNELLESRENQTEELPHLSMIAYGRIPMMVTANCIARTTGACRHQTGTLISMKDRYQKTLPVYLNCRHCYNMIYNSVRLSLHNHIHQLKQMNLHALRLDFTIEDGKTTAEVLSYFNEQYKISAEKAAKPPYEEYTNGHWKRGVE